LILIDISGTEGADAIPFIRMQELKSGISAAPDGFMRVFQAFQDIFLF
jgi:hypothetical protein